MICANKDAESASTRMMLEKVAMNRGLNRIHVHVY